MDQKRPEVSNVSVSTRRLLLIRHAQGSLGSSNYDRLSALGYRQARHLADHLEPEIAGASVVHGSLQRHRQTASAFGGLAIERVDPGLDEYRVDHLLKAASDRAEELQITLPDSAAFRDPGRYLDLFRALFPRVLAAWQAAELACELNGTWREFRERVDAAGVRLLADLERAPTVIAVTSAGVISTLAAGLLGHDLGWQRQLNVALYNASVTELRFSVHHGWKAVAVNAIDHLPNEQLQTLA
jgi:broad specificity phosphatase PhoE